jgi:hypothetical protein
MNSDASLIYPYTKTIVNILNGNPKSVNASQYKESPYFGLYKDLTPSRMLREIKPLSPQYVEIMQTAKREKFALTEKGYHLLIEEQSKHLDDFINNPLFNKLFHFNHELTTFDDNYFEAKFNKQKEVNQIKDNLIGTVYLDSIKKEVEYESKPEKLFLEYLNQNKAVKNIKTQSLVIHYGTEKRPRKYYPDFILQTHENKIIILEIKAITEMSHHTNMKKYMVLKKYCEEHGYGYGMIGYEGKFFSYESIEKRPLSQKFINHMNYILKNQYIYTDENYKHFRSKNNVHPLDIHTYVLRNQIKKETHFNKIKLINKKVSI